MLGTLSRAHCVFCVPPALPHVSPRCHLRQTKVEEIVQEVFDACKTNHHASQ